MIHISVLPKVQNVDIFLKPKSDARCLHRLEKFNVLSIKFDTKRIWADLFSESDKLGDADF